MYHILNQFIAVAFVAGGFNFTACTCVGVCVFVCRVQQRLETVRGGTDGVGVHAQSQAREEMERIQAAKIEAQLAEAHQKKTEEILEQLEAEKVGVVLPTILSAFSRTDSHAQAPLCDTVWVMESFT